MEHDVIIRGGWLYDGLGTPAERGDLAIDGDTIASIGCLSGHRGRREIDAEGLSVAPGFINMLSWACESLLEDGRSLSDIKQGVTLEVFGEGVSMGPMNSQMKEDRLERQGDIKYSIAWSELSEYLDHLVRLGVSCNVASFVGATTVRTNVLGRTNRQAGTAELQEMCHLVRQAMAQGALGVGSALIYAPACYASTQELVALASSAAEYGGMYISHLRSEGDAFLEALAEFLEIARQSGAASEIYHLKAAGKSNWDKLPQAIDLVAGARAQGLPVTANMYTYTAACTGLDAAMPPWVQEGGHKLWLARLQDKDVRCRVEREMTVAQAGWENGLIHAGAENMTLVGFKSQALKPLTGKTLAQVALARGQSPEATAIDLVIEDDSPVDTIYGWMSEENVRLGLSQPWVSLGSDGASLAPSGVFLKSSVHPRSYGNFARFLGKYIREEKLMSLSEGIRRLTDLPASNLKLVRRGRLTPGFIADITVFDQDSVGDLATFDDPHQFATGVRHVFVNGRAVLSDGQPTGQRPGVVVRGPGWRGK